MILNTKTEEIVDAILVLKFSQQTKTQVSSTNKYNSHGEYLKRKLNSRFHECEYCNLQRRPVTGQSLACQRLAHHMKTLM